MAMHAHEFFADLRLPFADSAVVGSTYYATPVPGGPVRLRIDFCRTIRADEYDGMRLAVIHRNRGELDVAVLRFADHGTFDHRDATQGRTPGQSGFGTFKEFRDEPGRVPWTGAHTNRLRGAIEQYVTVWFPGTWKVPAPARPAGRTASRAPAPTAHPGGSRSR